MTDQHRADERIRRDAAQAAAGEPVENVGVVAGRDLAPMLSVRIDAALAAELRSVAQARDTNVSDLLRAAVARVVADYHAQETSFRGWASNGAASIVPSVTISFGSSGTVEWSTVDGVVGAA